MRPLLVVLPAKGVETPLLSPRVGGRWAGGCALEGAVHALVAGVVLRLAWPDSLVLNAQPNPPHRQRAQSVQPGGRKRRAVVRADRSRQADAPKQPFERRPCLLGADRAQRLAAEQISRVLVGDGQRVAIDPIAGAELTL